MATAWSEAGIDEALQEAKASRMRRVAAGLVTARAGVVLVSALWAGGFASVAVLRHLSGLTQRYDLGNMTQAVYNTAHGRFLEVTEVGGEQVTRLGIHVDPILAALVPLWWVWPSPVMLLVVQAVALSLGAFPVFWLGRKHLGSDAAGLKIVLVYLLYPPLQWNVIHEFHAVAFAVPLILFAIWFLDERRMVPFAACAAAAILTKEQIGLMIAIVGIWHAARSRQIRQGIAIAGVGAAWSVLALAVVIPHFSGGPSPYQARYQSVGGTPAGIVETFFTEPQRIVQALATPFDLAFVVLLGLPLLGICYLSPLILAAGPQFAISMLSDRIPDTDFTAQNSLPIIPFVIAAAVLASGRIARRPNALASRLLVASIGIAVLIGPARFLGSLGEGESRDLPAHHLEAQREALSLIPSDARVSATNRLGGRLAERRYAYVFPTVERADWIAVDVHDAWLPTRRSFSGRKGLHVGVRDGFLQPGRMNQLVTELRQHPSWEVVFERSGVLVFRRTPSE